MSLYAAICYELLGHAAHLFSSNKISHLTQALDYLVEADGALPAPVLLPRLPVVEESRPSTPVSPEESVGSADSLDSLEFSGDFEIAFSPEPDTLVQRIMRMIDSALVTLDDDPFFSDDETDNQQPFARTLMQLTPSPPVQPLETWTALSPSRAPVATNDPVKKEFLLPGPLRIGKITKPTTSPANVTGKLTTDSGLDNVLGRYRPPRLPLKIIPASQLNSGLPVAAPDKSTSQMPVLPHPLPALPGLKSTTDPAKEPQIPTYLEEIDPVRAARIVRSNRGIAFLHELISTNIAEIHRHIDQVTEIQRTRRARKMQRAASFWSFHPIQSDESTVPSEPEPTLDEFGNILLKETRSQRIARLRAENWNTVGLRSPRSTWKGARYYQEFCAMVLNELYLDG